jgi:hypothetical protein
VVQAFTQDDRIPHKVFAVTILEKLDKDKFLRKIMFSDVLHVLHVSGKLNKQYVHIWGSEHPHATVEHITDSPKINVWCSLLHDYLIGPFFFNEVTLTSIN